VWQITSGAGGQPGGDRCRWVLMLPTLSKDKQEPAEKKVDDL